MPLKQGDVCTLRLRQEAPWHPAAPQEREQPRLAPLEAMATLRVTGGRMTDRRTGSRIARAMALAFLAAALAAADEAPPRWTVELVTEYAIDRPLAQDGATDIVAAVFVAGATPLRLEVDERSYDVEVLLLGTVAPESDRAADDIATWGPDIAVGVPVNPANVRISGAAEAAAAPWPKRDGIVLRPGEGYARIVGLLPDWSWR
ncbi:MAG: hypothetical protein H0V44_12610, partial [Planctomycetes bacterium]|nr:hypothetical protein [Planctomycetota bacterium]